MFCPKCGTQLPDGAAFCGSCGTALARGGAGQPNQPGQAATPAQPGQIPASSQPAAWQAGYTPQGSAAAENAVASGAIKAGASGLSKIAIAVAALVALAIAVVVINPFNADPQTAYAKAFEKIAGSGSWHEQVDIAVDMSMVGTGDFAINYDTSTDMTMDMDVSRYNPSDATSAIIEGSGTLDMDMGDLYESLGIDASEVPSNFPFTFIYKNRILTMDMGEAGQTTQAIDIGQLSAVPENYSDIWDSATINGNTITFHIDGENMLSRINSLVSSESNISLDSLSVFNNVVFDDLNYTLTMERFSGDIKAHMTFGASLEDSGQSIVVHYRMDDTISKA